MGAVDGVGSGVEGVGVDEGDVAGVVAGVVAGGVAGGVAGVVANGENEGYDVMMTR